MTAIPSGEREHIMKATSVKHRSTDRHSPLMNAANGSDDVYKEQRLAYHVGMVTAAVAPWEEDRVATTWSKAASAVSSYGDHGSDNDDDHEKGDEKGDQKHPFNTTRTPGATSLSKTMK